MGSSTFTPPHTLEDYWADLNPHRRRNGMSRSAVWNSVTARPDWTELRDVWGTTPLMRALRIHPFLTQRLTPRTVPAAQFQARDGAGRSLAFHLFLGLTRSASRGPGVQDAAEPFDWLRASSVPYRDTRGRGLLDQWEQDTDEAAMLLGATPSNVYALSQAATADRLGPPQNWLSDREEDVAAWRARFERCPPDPAPVQWPAVARVFAESPAGWNRAALENWSAYPDLVAHVGYVLSRQQPPTPGASVWVDAWLEQPVSQWPEQVIERAKALLDTPPPTVLCERIKSAFVAGDLTADLAAPRPGSRLRL